MYYYQLEKGSKKHRCPKCEKVRVYKRYVDPEGNYAEYKYGRCDREQKCGYHEIPNRPISSNVVEFPLIEPKPIKHIPRNEVLNSLGEYKDRNQLFDFLCSYFPEKDVMTAFKSYCIGTHKAYPKATVFWYINGAKQVTRGKIMAYDKTGHRIKKPYPQISSAHKELGLTEFEQDKCLFGEHLLRQNPDKIVCIVESEKSAIVASLFSPEYIWLACGSASQLNSRWLKGLQNRKVHLFPDRGQEENWGKKIEQLQTQTKCRIKLSNLLLNQTIAINGSGDDIADLILNSLKPNNNRTNAKPQPTDEISPKNELPKAVNSDKLKVLIKKNPSIIKLMDKLGLEEECSKNVFREPS